MVRHRRRRAWRRLALILPPLSFVLGALLATTTPTGKNRLDGVTEVVVVVAIPTTGGVDTTTTAATEEGGGGAVVVGGGPRAAAYGKDDEHDGRRRRPRRDVAAAGDSFYDLPSFTDDERLSIAKMAYALTRYGDLVDWDRRREDYVRSLTGPTTDAEGRQRRRRRDDGEVAGAGVGVVAAVVSAVTGLGGPPGRPRDAAAAADVDGDEDDDDRLATSSDGPAPGERATIASTGGGGADKEDVAHRATSEASGADRRRSGNDGAYGGATDDTLDGATASAGAGGISAMMPASHHLRRRRLQEGGGGMEGGDLNEAITEVVNQFEELEDGEVNGGDEGEAEGSGGGGGGGSTYMGDGDVFDGYEYAKGNCDEAGDGAVPCAPADLRSLCDKYDRAKGSFRSCLNACKPAFCCIHDAPADTNYLAPNCNDDPNCPAYSYCYIAWWKLHDTVGPALFLRVEQDDEFYDVDATEFEGDATGDPFFTQVLLHHFDDIDEVIADGTVDNVFTADNIFLNEEYWSYPVVSKVDIED